MDNSLLVTFNADTSNLLSGVSAVNAALETTSVKARSPATDLFVTLQKSSDQAVAGIIKGTETWQAALVNVARNVEVRFAQLALNRLMNDTIADALGLRSAQVSDDAKIQSTLAKNTAIQASDQSATAATSSSNAMQLIKQIKSDAAATYAGVYAFLSPVLGPAAAIPAGVSAAAVAGMEGLVSLDVGAWNVPQNMPAFLHAGEMVVPQNFAAGLRSGGGIGGGGDNYTININAVDTQTGAQFLKNNASVIASALSSQVRNFNKNVPAWKS